MTSRSLATFRKTTISTDILLPYIFLHLVCVGVFWTGITWKGVGLCLASYFIRGFGLGVGYHRYFAHRSFKTSRALQFLLALLGSLSIQRGVLWWAETHRHHHRCADQPDDIHSPTYQGFLYAHSGWFLDRKYREADHTKVSDLSKFPELVWLDHPKFYFIPIALYALLIYLFFGWQGLFWGFAVSTVLLWHMTHWIQSMSHRFGGYRRCQSPDQSRNHWLLGLLTWGEFHNNHHSYPSSCRQGFVWWEIDFGYYVLKVLSWFGLVWDLRTPPESIRRGQVQPATR
jgi:stearoyl-CoA desaturase (delta-9 desaturase)